MKLDMTFVNRFRGLRDSVQAGTMSRDEKKRLAQSIWNDIHRAYGLADRPKLKVELDGDLAGELRIKDTGAVYNPPDPAPTVSQASSIFDDPENLTSAALAMFARLNDAATTEVKTDPTRAVLIGSDGIAHVCTSISELFDAADGDLSQHSIFRVAA